MKDLFAKLKRFTDENIKWFTLVYVIVCAVIICFMLPRGDDFAFHIQRLNAIADNIKIGSSNRIYSTTLNNYGYASPLFYGDIYMHPFAWLIVAGLPVLAAYKIMLICMLGAVYASISFVMSKLGVIGIRKDYAVFCYILLGPIYGNIVGSIIGRGFATIFLPIVFMGLVMLIYESNKYSWLYFGLGMAGVMYSNLIDAVICVFASAVMLIFFIKQLNGKLVVELIMSVGICLIVSANLLFPMLEQMIGGGGTS